MSEPSILLEAGTGEFELVEFHIDELTSKGETYRGNYGVNVAKVLEIIRTPKLTLLPEASHPAVLGAFDHRNRIVPVLDLAAWLGKDVVPSKDERVMLCEFNQVISAFQVSAVSRIHRVSWADLEQPDGASADMAGKALTGVVRVDGKLILVLDMESILADLAPHGGMELDKEVLAATPHKSSGYRAVVAEDSPSTRQLLVGLLSQAGFTVEQFPNGQLALDRLEQYAKQVEAEGRPLTDYVNVLVTDIEMPALDGLTLTRRVRENRHLRNLPIIVFSSLITEAQYHKGKSVGADDQIAKPDITHLAQRAFELIEARASSA